MHLWLEIVARELAMLATLLALGIGPASFLGRRFDAAARLAIAPALGLCLATCVFTTLIWFTAARNTSWLLPAIAAVSIASALRQSLVSSTGATNVAHRARRAFTRLRAHDMLSLMLVCVAVAAPLSYTLHERNSVGPTGFLIMDTDGYTATADGMEHLSLREAQRPVAENANFVHGYWHHIASKPWNVDASPLAANLDLLIGLHATDTQSLFLIVFLVTGALGAFATVRYLAPKPSWTAPVAGALFAGPLFLQLMADGSQAAVCGLAVLMPLAAVGIDTLRELRLANLVLLALLASGLMAIYPLYFPVVAAAAALVLAAIAAIKRLRGQLTWRSLRRAARAIAAVTALTIVFDVVTVTRAVRYWLETIGGDNLAFEPIYHLPLSVLPGWVLQTQQFFLAQNPPLPYLPSLAQAPALEALSRVALPAIMIAVIAFGLWRNRRGLILVSIVVVFATIAEYASVAQHCSYCVDRDTLPSAPTGIVLLMLGIGALASAPRRWLRFAAIAIAVAAVIAVGAQTWTERQLFAAEAYYLGGDERSLVSDLPAHAGPVALEGFGQSPEGETSIGEQPLVYTLAYERNHGEVSMPSEYTDYSGLSYFGGPKPRNPQFTPDYRYVLTRLGGVHTGRRVIARAGPLALEQRTAPLDVIVTSGIAFPLVRQESSGLPSVAAELHLLLIGGGAQPALILLRFSTIAQATALAQPHLLARATPHELVVCVPVTGVAPVRKAALQLAGSLYQGSVSSEKFALAAPSQGITLVAMRAVSHCPI